MYIKENSEIFTSDILEKGQKLASAGKIKIVKNTSQCISALVNDQGTFCVELNIKNKNIISSRCTCNQINCIHIAGTLFWIENSLSSNFSQDINDELKKNLTYKFYNISQSNFYQFKLYFEELYSKYSSDNSFDKSKFFINSLFITSPLLLQTIKKEFIEWFCSFSINKLNDSELKHFWKQIIHSHHILYSIYFLLLSEFLNSVENKNILFDELDGFIKFDAGDHLAIRIAEFVMSLKLIPPETFLNTLLIFAPSLKSQFSKFVSISIDNKYFIFLKRLYSSYSEYLSSLDYMKILDFLLKEDKIDDFYSLLVFRIKKEDKFSFYLTQYNNLSDDGKNHLYSLIKDGIKNNSFYPAFCLFHQIKSNISDIKKVSFEDLSLLKPYINCSLKKKIIDVIISKIENLISKKTKKQELTNALFCLKNYDSSSFFETINRFNLKEEMFISSSFRNQYLRDIYKSKAFDSEKIYLYEE